MSKTQQEAKRLYLIPCIQGYESTKDPKNSKPILFLFLFFLNGVFFFLGGGGLWGWGKGNLQSCTSNFGVSFNFVLGLYIFVILNLNSAICFNLSI